LRGKVAVSLKRFRYRKVTPEMMVEMEKLRKQGLTYPEIAEKFGISLAIVYYHLNPEYRRKRLEREGRRQKTRKVREYNAKRRRSEEYRRMRREYMRERYREDAEFRERMVQMSRRQKSKGQ
jgi:transposase